jgi:hypothetical protein
MLSKLEIGTHDHIKAWLMNKPEGEVYEWASADCPQGQYFKQHGDPLDGRVCERIWPDTARLNQLGSKFKTFGELARAF